MNLLKIIIFSIVMATFIVGSTIKEKKARKTEKKHELDKRSIK